jgi:hypothetical protein
MLTCNRTCALNTHSNDIVNATSNISYTPMLQADCVAVIFMNEVNNLSNVVIGKLGTKLFSKLLFFIL